MACSDHTLLDPATISIKPIADPAARLLDTEPEDRR
jgi:hypothetical protein